MTSSIRFTLLTVSVALIAGCTSSSSQLKSQPTGHPLGAAYELTKSNFMEGGAGTSGTTTSDFYAFYNGTGIARFVDGKNWVGLFDYSKRNALIGDLRTLTYVPSGIDPVKFPVIADESEAASFKAQSLGTGVVRNFPCHKWKVVVDGLACEIWTDDFDRFPVYYTTNSGNDTITWTVKNCWVEPAVLSVPGFFTLDNFVALQPGTCEPHILKRLKGLDANNCPERAYLKGAAATDAVLDEISSNSSLQALDLDRSARISNKGLASLSKMHNLKVLRIDEPAITDAGIARISMVPSLVSLQLYAPPLHDSALTGLKKLDNLHHLSLAETSVNGKALKELSRFPKLRSLDLAKTHVNDASLASLSKCQSLTELRLDGTRIGINGLKNLATVKSLKTVSIIGSETPISDEELAAQKFHFKVRLRYTD